MHIFLGKGFAKQIARSFGFEYANPHDSSYRFPRFGTSDLRDYQLQQERQLIGRLRTCFDSVKVWRDEMPGNHRRGIFAWKC